MPNNVPKLTRADIAKLDAQDAHIARVVLKYGAIAFCAVILLALFYTSFVCAGGKADFGCRDVLGVMGAIGKAILLFK